MRAERWRRLSTLFDRAVEAPAEERERFLERACAGDARLRRTLERWLRADGESGPLDRPLCRLAEGLPAAAHDGNPEEKLGPYRLLRPLRQGGMGRVYLAVRDDDVFRRRVAIKRVRPDAGGGPGLIDGLRREIRILARLEHPSIARLYDGGLGAGGEPYLVMEYVEGEKITASCERRRLSAAGRVRLLLGVCDAVAHAHRRGVIHCDLKPSNVLVDAEGRPRLVDFGIARILDTGADDTGDDTGGDDTGDDDAGGYSGAGRRPMTPAYASPEQRRGEAPTAASDVYALGLLLRELLGGRLRGDLRAVAERALEELPGRRYATVEGLADDLRRHLAARPVRARRPTWGYRGGRFARRHRWALGASLAIAALLTTLLLAGWRHADHLAHLERLRTGAHRLAGELTALAAALGRDEGDAGSPTAPLLELALGQASLETPGRPQLEAMVLYALGRARLEAGLYRQAEPLLERALDLRRAAPGPDASWDLASSLHALGAALTARGELERGEALLGEALASRRRLLGPRHPAVAETLEALARNRWRRLDLAAAETLQRQAVAIRLATCGALSQPSADALSDVAALARTRGALDEAEAVAAEARSLRHRILEEDHPGLARSLDDLGDLAFARGAFRDAEGHYRRALELRRASLGERHTAVAHSWHNLGRALGEGGRYAAARHALGEALALHRALAPGDGPGLATLLNNLAVVAGNQGDRAAAEALFHQVLELRLAHLGAGHPHVGQAHYSLGVLLHDASELDAAEASYRRAQEIIARTLPPGHPAFAYPAVAVARLHLDRGEAEAAESQLREALEQLRAGHPAGHWRIANAESLLGAALLARGLTEAARPLLERGHTVLERQRGPQAPRTRRAARRLAALDTSALGAPRPDRDGRE